jgi:DNA-binding IclR family transcriptional regulator
LCGTCFQVANEPADDHEVLADGELIGESKDRNLVTALARGIEILRCFTPEESRLGNQDLATKTGLAKATVSRLTYTLSKLGCLKKSPISGKYHLDVGVLAFGHQTLLNLSARTIARPYMTELAEYAQAAVGMATRDRLQMIYLDIVDGPTQFTTRRQVGSYLPIHLSAMGRACLAAMTSPERELILTLVKERHPDDWREIRRGLDRAFQDYADYGYCLGNITREVNSVAVPLIHKEHGILTFGCVAPSFQLPREKLEEDIGPRLKHMVAQIEAVVR